ncbi:MAG: twitching motility protein PilT [Thermoplasmata archaeon]|nr:twitching motility protein PilT [Thermoplasmata archaeon]TFG70376.1 MAG: twitching motility protein PilT [Methanomassiliicoccus sp.]
MISAVVLDANALLMPFQFKIHLDRELKRLFGEVPVLIPSSVIDELSNIHDKHAKAAMALAKKYAVVETSMRGDDAVLSVARDRSAAVLTNDRELISRLRAENIPVVRLRSGRYLIFNPHGIE